MTKDLSASTHNHTIRRQAQQATESSRDSGNTKVQREPLDPKSSEVVPEDDFAIGFLSGRAYSDSVLPSNQFSETKRSRIVQHVHLTAASKPHVDHAQSGQSSSQADGPSPSRRDDSEMKERPSTSSISKGEDFKPVVQSAASVTTRPKHSLHLPNFHSLGISNVPLVPISTPHEGVPSSLPESRKLDLQNVKHTDNPTLHHVSTPLAQESQNEIIVKAQQTQQTSQNSQHQTSAMSNIADSNALLSPSDIDETPTPTGIIHSPEESQRQGQWADRWIHSATQKVLDGLSPGSVVTILCHSQPCPLPRSQNAQMVTAFHRLVEQLEHDCPSGVFLDVTHAVPSKFSMSQVPESPSLTPDTALSQAQDYFSMQMIYSKAVVTANYRQAWSERQPSSPHPVVPPASINVSLLERYIPPQDPNEFFDLFASRDAPSALVNRLVELSHKNGVLMFAYPTKKGAKSFFDNHFEPIIHPLLRTLAGVHDLMSDLPQQVASYPAVDRMLSFEGVTKKLNSLLQQLNQNRTLPSSANQSHSSLSDLPVRSQSRLKASYKLIDSQVQNVPLNRTSWTEWWIHQEHERIQAVVHNYFSRGVRLPVSGSITEAGLIREIYEGVRTRAYPNGLLENCDEYDTRNVGPVEMGLWVIERSTS